MNSKPDIIPRFAVNRADMLSRLPGVKLPASSKRFARGKPRLSSIDQVNRSAMAFEATFPSPASVWRER